MKILLYYCQPCQQGHAVCPHPKPDELQLMLPQLISVKSVLMSWHLNPGLPCCLFLLGPPPQKKPCLVKFTGKINILAMFCQ